MAPKSEYNHGIIRTPLTVDAWDSPVKRLRPGLGFQDDSADWDEASDGARHRWMAMDTAAMATTAEAAGQRVIIQHFPRLCEGHAGAEDKSVLPRFLLQVSTATATATLGV